MSTKPHPVALTAAMLATRKAMDHMDRAQRGQDTALETSGHESASLASRLHRLANGARRASVAECNGEMHGGQRDAINSLCANNWGTTRQEETRAVCVKRLQQLDEQVAKYSARIDKQISRLNDDLQPLALIAKRNGDPRGFPILLHSTDPSLPVPSNVLGGAWGIA